MHRPIQDILKLLSDEEVARLNTAAEAAGLSDGDEYLDLELLDKGVQRELGTRRQSGACFREKPCAKLRGEPY
jgi:hypothetical protein